METPEFREALDTSGDRGHSTPGDHVREAVPWRCHRTLIADALTACGIAVNHIMGKEKLRPHETTRFARIESGRVKHPAEDAPCSTVGFGRNTPAEVEMVRASASVGKRASNGSRAIAWTEPVTHIRRHPLPVFFAGAFGISWLAMLPSILGPPGLGLFHTGLPNTFSIRSGSIVFPLWITLASFGPTLAALIAQKVCYGQLRGFRFVTSLRQILIGTIVGMLCVLLARWLLSAIGLTRSGYTAWNWAALLNFRYYFIFSLVAGPIGEEPGWRGFALPILQSRYRPSPYGPAKASLLLGLIWSIWHLPLFLIRGWTTSPFWTYAIIVTALSVIITFAYNLSGGSVIHSDSGA